MIRGFKPEAAQRNENFARIARAKIVEHKVSRDKLMKLAEIGSATLSHRFFSKKTSPEPDMMTIKELRVYCKLLKFSDDDILNFIRG